MASTIATKARPFRTRVVSAMLVCVTRKTEEFRQRRGVTEATCIIYDRSHGMLGCHDRVRPAAIVLVCGIELKDLGAAPIDEAPRRQQASA